MNLKYSPVDPELEVLFEEGRVIRRLPDVARARALARARATVAANVFVPVRPAPMPRVGLRVGVAATVALFAGAAASAAALHRRAPAPGESPPPGASPPRASRTEHKRASAPPPSVVIAEGIQSVDNEKAAPRPPTNLESYAAEVDLLQRAQAAFAKGDLAETLAIVARHAHRFPNGRLSEEREAFRIRSLVGSGQANEARRALAAFTRRFPRSVLLTRLQETANSAAL